MEKHKNRGKGTTSTGDRDDDLGCDMDAIGYATSMVDTCLPCQHTHVMPR